MGLRPIGDMPLVISRDDLRPFYEEIERLKRLPVDARIERIEQTAREALDKVNGFQLLSQTEAFAIVERALRDILSDARRTG